MTEKLPKDQKFKKRKIESTVKSNLHLVDLEVLNEKVKKFTLFDPLVICFFFIRSSSFGLMSPTDSAVLNTGIKYWRNG